MTHSALVVAEQGNGELSRVSWEAIAAARQLSPARLMLAVLGASVAGILDQTQQVDEVWAVEHPLLARYTWEGYTTALQQLIEEFKPEYVVFPHTYQCRDFTPTLAAFFHKSVINDCTGIELADDGQPVFVRQLFQGKVLAETVAIGEPPHFVSVQTAAFSPANEATGPRAPVVMRRYHPCISGEQFRVKYEAPFRAEREAIDLSVAELIVAVGRGIRAPEHVATARRLSQLLGGGLAGTRPVCDEGWLPFAHQVGSSGQTVAPRVYLALGLSGATQHLVGMRGSHT
ncbi:MAG: electron transfer flavoprotein subunit alpha/FixB family protein, partial [Gammaproteobacteria bacterium]